MVQHEPCPILVDSAPVIPCVIFWCLLAPVPTFHSTSVFMVIDSQDPFYPISVSSKSFVFCFPLNPLHPVIRFPFLFRPSPIEKSPAISGSVPTFANLHEH